MKAYYERMKNAFGIKFILLIVITQCLLKGINFVIMSKGLLPFFKSLGVDGVQLQVYGAIGLSPWTIKPLIGCFSDLVAFGGYHKRFTMIFACLVGVVGSVFLVIGFELPLLIVLFVTCVHFAIAVSDLLVEGKYAELMREHPETASDIVTLANGLQQVGFLICISFLGPLSDLGYFRIIFSISLAISFVPIFPVLAGWLPEVPIPNSPYILLDTKRVRRDWRIITVVLITGLSAPAMASIAAFAAKWLGVVCALVVISVCVVGSFWAMPHPLIARVALFQVLSQVSRISFSNVLDYFFVADPICLPGGPNFSYKFYITITGLVSAGAAILTTFVYQLLFSKWKFRNVLLFTSTLSALSGIFDFIIVKRWNLVMGIPDTYFFLVGDDVLSSIVSMLYWIPSSSIIGKVCPKHMEASTYAFLAGISNFGTMIGTLSGAMLSEAFGIKTTGVCNWHALPYLVLVGHVIVVILVAIPAAFLIPNVDQNVNILELEQQKQKQNQSIVIEQKNFVQFNMSDDEDGLFN